MKEQIEEKACKNCIHYQMCVDTFRKAKQDGEILLIEEEAYFANAYGCDFYADKRIYRKRSEGGWGIRKIGDGGTTRTCSNCHISQTVNVYKGKVMFKYCPYCGAHMKGGAE